MLEVITTNSILTLSPWPS